MTGNELKQARQSAGLTQQQLGERWGLHRVTVQLWERSKENPVPNPKMVKILVDDLNRKQEQ